MPLKLRDARGQRLEFRSLTVAVRLKLGEQRGEGGTEQANNCPPRSANDATSDSPAS